MEDTPIVILILGVLVAIVLAIVFGQTGLSDAQIPATTTVSVIKTSVNDAHTTVTIDASLQAAPDDRFIWAAYKTPSNAMRLAACEPVATDMPLISLKDCPLLRSQIGSQIVFLMANTDTNQAWRTMPSDTDGTKPISQPLPEGVYELHRVSTVPMTIDSTAAA